MNISKELLIHSAFAFPLAGMNADRQSVFDPPIELKSVWIDVTDAQTDSSNGKQNADSGTLFFDCLNSEPKDFIPSKNMKIVFDGIEYTINSIKKCYGLKGLEHFECGLK